MTVQRKTLAKGAILSVGPVSGSLAEYGRVINVKLPDEDYETVDAPELNPQDDSGTAIDGDPIVLGDEIFGEASFEHYWDPQHADGTLLDGYWSNKTELTWRLTTPHATGAATISFNGYIKMLSPQQMSKREYFRRQVTIVRTSAITNAAVV